MTFRPGQPKPPGSGKKKGTKNKKTLRLRDLLEDRAVDFEGELAKAVLAKDVEMIKALKDLLPYLQPRIKEQEEPAKPEVEPDDSDDLSDDELIQELDEQRGLQS
jgi:hypothetical protein